MQREAFIHRPPAPGRRGAALADQRGRRHLPAGHAIDRVVDEEDADFFSAIGGVDDFGRADRGQVSIALIGDHNLVGTSALQARRRCRRATVRDLHVAHVEIVVGEDRAADGADQDRPILQAQIFQRLGDELVRHPMAASRAVVSLMFQVALALILGIEHVRFRMHDFVIVG